MQPDIPLAVKHGNATEGVRWTVLARLTLEAGAGRPDLIIWPETARPRTLVHDPSRPESWAMHDVGSLAVRTAAAVLTGAEYVVGDVRVEEV